MLAHRARALPGVISPSYCCAMEDRETQIVKRSEREVAEYADLRIPLELSPEMAVVILSQLKLALRQPANHGASTGAVKAFISDMLVHMRRLGLNGCADLVALGSSEPAPPPEQDAPPALVQ